MSTVISSPVRLAQVYLARHPLGPVKIGYSGDPPARVRQLGAGVELLHAIDSADAYALEQALHARFSPRRVVGEWFWLTETDLRRFALLDRCDDFNDLPVWLFPAEGVEFPRLTDDQRRALMVPNNRVEFRADEEWIRQVTEEADRWGLGLSAYIRLAVNEKMERDRAQRGETEPEPKPRRRKGGDS